MRRWSGCLFQCHPQIYAESEGMEEMEGVEEGGGEIKKQKEYCILLRAAQRDAQEIKTFNMSR